jgi:pyrroloquinoline quinone biosynthesis protein B
MIFLIANLISFLFSLSGQLNQEEIHAIHSNIAYKDSVYLTVLGIAQDGGYPQMGCTKSCCMAIKQGKEAKKQVVSLGLISGSKFWLFEATPDIVEQLGQMQQELNQSNFQLPQGIFLSHAHIGHYTGLQYFGREAMGTNKQTVFAMPKMDLFLKTNGPWSQLVALNNIAIQPIQNKIPVVLEKQISVTPIQVPHRDEYSETVGFLIQSPRKKVLFIPDIDKWEKWDESIIDLIRSVDFALIDGTFFQNGELPNRDMSEVPHPFVEESLKYFDWLSPKEKSKICFIHFNHTNPLIKKQSPQKDQLIKKGYRVAEEGMRITL